MRQCLSDFLYSYRTTPHTTTDISPGELFLQRKMRIRLDLLKPDQQKSVSHRQMSSSNMHHSPREFNIGAEILLRNYRQGDKWIWNAVVDINRVLGLASDSMHRSAMPVIDQRCARG